MQLYIDIYPKAGSPLKQRHVISVILYEIKNGFMKYSGFEKEDHLDGISLYCGDCMDLLKQTPDKYYSLALVDPPYEIGID